MIASTQIGGKYHKDDDSLFHLKEILRSAGIAVSHPIADRIMYSNNGQGFAFDPAQMSFYEVEKDYYDSIASSDFHTVNNVFLEDKGYVGESAALEMAYAMTHHKPVVIMYPIHLKDSLDGGLKKILLERVDRIEVHNMHKMEPDTIKTACQALRGRLVDYGLPASEERFVADKVRQLFVDIKERA